ncbi:MAG: AMP-binding protein [Pseudomonadales bacterium]|nr:AMP-binding protein [Pseudomonadales bacterium]
MGFPCLIDGRSVGYRRHRKVRGEQEIVNNYTLEDAVATGMCIAWQAERFPEVMAVSSRYGERTFAALNSNANRLVRCLREAGLEAGDAIAVVARNRPEFVEVMAAGMRSGLRVTPINFHLKADEIGYIVDNCEAKVFIADASLGTAPIAALDFAPNVRLALAIGGEMPGFEPYSHAIADFSGEDIQDPVLGSRMLYTSGTTGRPKGVYRKDRIPEQPQGETSSYAFRAGEDRVLVTGPGYHAAPLLIDIITPLVSGVGIVMMDKWDAEETLRLIQEHRITHSHMVATMFHRLLHLPEAVRQRYDISSLRRVIHGAAPCPVHVKQAMIDWFGPIIWEYYAATEGGGGFLVGSEEWLRKPGTVGKPGPEFDNRILDDEGNPVPPGTIGTIYMRAPAHGRFEYYKDTKKTDGSYRGDYFTLGDMGYFDEDGYLFLTGRTAELIISGGVNIYPVEVDNELLKHPGVHDACTIGAPSEEWGEEVKSVVCLKPGYTASPLLAEELIEWTRQHLAAFKCPRSVDFVDSIPRSEAGKVQRKEIRARYWP